MTDSGAPAQVAVFWDHENPGVGFAFADVETYKRTLSRALEVGYSKRLAALLKPVKRDLVWYWRPIPPKRKKRNGAKP